MKLLGFLLFSLMLVSPLVSTANAQVVVDIGHRHHHHHHHYRHHHHRYDHH